MKTRNSALYALGLAAAITLGGAVTAGAQAKKPTRKPVKRVAPKTQIPVTKEVTAVRVDTVIVTRVDTVTLRRADTVATTVLRTDTVTRMVYPPLAPLPGLFFGIGAGANIPMNDIRGVFKDGLAGQAQVGYFPTNSPLGLRVDGTIGKIGKRETDCRVAACASPTVWTVGGDVILRMPLDRTSKLNPVIYVFGGGGWSHFGDIAKPQQLVGPYDRTPGHFIDVSGGHGYWDVGPGVDFSLGGLHLYAEGKYMTIMTSGKSSHMFPVFGGIKLY
jgi:hypothetical protein